MVSISWRVVLGPLLLMPLLAQGPIYVVDANAGAGSQFTDLQTAVQAVPDGSTIWVRTGSYSPVAIVGKGVSIVADGFVRVQSLRIANTAPHQPVVVTRVGIEYGGSIVITGASGPVTLDGDGTTVSGSGHGFPVLRAQAALQVHLRGWRLRHDQGDVAASILGGSSVIFENCTLNGSALVTAELNMLAAPAIDLYQSTAQLVESIALGGNGGLSFHPFGGWVPYQGAPGVRMQGSTLWCRGVNRSIQGGYDPGQTGGQQQPSITGAGVVRADIGLPLLAAPAPGVQVIRSVLPRLVVTCAPPGAAATVRRSGPSGVLAALLVSLRGAPWLLPGLPDPIWIDPASMVVDTVGVVPSHGVLQVSHLMPNAPALRGFTCTWQALDLDPTGQLQASNPSHLSVL